jgi:uncharacterized protein YciI
MPVDRAPYLSTEGRQAPSGRKKAAPTEAELLLNETPVGVPNQEAAADRSATADAMDPDRTAQALKAIERQIAMEPDQRKQKAMEAAWRTIGLMSLQSKDKPFYDKREYRDNTTQQAVAGRDFAVEGGVTPGQVLAPLDKEGAVWKLLTSGRTKDAQGSPIPPEEIVRETLESAAAQIMAKVPGSGITGPDDVRVRAKAALSEPEVARYREVLASNPEFAQMSFDDFSAIDDFVRDKLLVAKLMANNAGQQQMFYKEQAGGALERRTLRDKLALENEAVDKMMAQEYGIENMAALLRGTGGGALDGARDMLGGARDWLGAKPAFGGEDPNWALRQVNKLPNWAYAGSAGLGGMAAILAAAGQPQQDNDDYLQLLAAQNAAPSPSSY